MLLRIAVLLFVLAVTTCQAYLVYLVAKNTNSVTVAQQQDIDFKKTQSDLAKDLVNRNVLLPTSNQFWSFSADQNIDIKTLNVKPHIGSEDTVVVNIKLSASTKTQVSETKEVQQNPKDKPVTVNREVTVELNGLARMVYEKIGQEWVLLAVESINLNANIKK